jgi:regulatory protein YycI of two-component signal transduction system YycFG
MTKTEFEEMTLDELIDWANENINDITYEDTLIEFAKQKIDDDNIYMAMHVLSAIYKSAEAYNDLYLYDYSMGTLETPTPITCKEDLEDYISFVKEEDCEIYTCWDLDEEEN